MSINVGDKMPNATFKTMTQEGPADKTTSEVFDGKKVVLFAVPGAFTPTCHLKHVPGFIENHGRITSKGVDCIAVVSVNDVFVMGAWEKGIENSGNLLFLSDGSGEFTKSIGMDIDLGEAGLGVRSKRYAMIVDNGIVKEITIDDSPGVAEASSADAILKLL